MVTGYYYFLSKCTFSILWNGCIVAFSFLKAFLRIRFIKELYIPKEFDRYLKMFHIKIKKKKKKKRTIKKKQSVRKKKTVLANAMVSNEKIKIKN